MKKNRTMEIRRALDELGPGAKPDEVQEVLKGRGVKVTNAYISSVKTIWKKTLDATEVKVHKKNGAMDLTEVVSFVRRTGGIEKAREVMKRLEELQI